MDHMQRETFAWQSCEFTDSNSLIFTSIKRLPNGSGSEETVKNKTKTQGESFLFYFCQKREFKTYFVYFHTFSYKFKVPTNSHRVWAACVYFCVFYERCGLNEGVLYLSSLEGTELLFLSYFLACFIQKILVTFVTFAKFADFQRAFFTLMLYTDLSLNFG